MTEWLNYLLFGWRAVCPYCQKGFSRAQWVQRDRETGGHAVCPYGTRQSGYPPLPKPLPPPPSREMKR